MLSPDGKRIAYASTTGLWLVPVAGGTPRRLLTLPEGDYGVEHPAWSRDGAGVYYTGVIYGDPIRRLLGYVDLKTGAPTEPLQNAWWLCLPRL